MQSVIKRLKLRTFVSVLMIMILLTLTAPLAAAADSGKDADRDATPPPAEAMRARRVEGAAETRVPTVLYAAFDAALGMTAAPEPASRPRKVSNLVPPRIDPMPVASIPLPSPLPPQASTAPMTAKEKFGYWFHSRFLSWGSYGSAVLSGVVKELQDNDDFKKDTTENFFADAGTRTVRSFTFGTTASFYEKAVLASLFRQDPRYHRSQKSGAGAKIGYAVSRVFVTQGDRCGCNQFNASFLLGGAAAAATANLWERRERTGPMHTVARYYNHIAITAFFNIFREFVGGQ